MAGAWKAWRTVAAQWDVLTTGSPRGTGMTPVAAEIGDLALCAGRLAYRNPHWTPARRDAAQVRDPADLAQTPGDLITVLAAVHHAADAISRTAAADQQAVITAVADDRVYVPVRLLSDKYDIPHPYTPAPRAYTEALAAAYDSTAEAATRATAALDDLATGLNAPSALLAAARQIVPARPEPRRRSDRQPAPRLSLDSPVPGQIKHALRRLKIRDPALLLRAAVIDQAARDLISEATARANSRTTVTVPSWGTASSARERPGPAARIASQGAAAHAAGDATGGLPTRQCSGDAIGRARPALRGTHGARRPT
jgi:hypothetical protein